ncbi:MAG: hypothetical protein J0I12_23410 [Candidatus Eremiobacteraeota bacterium]|nr:hypothetical protein [Candidatus Eremiobacteraeota bacterium]
MATEPLEDHPSLSHIQDALSQPAPLDLRGFAREISQGVNSYLADLPWYSRWTAALEKWLDRPLNSFPRLALAVVLAGVMAWLSLDQPKALLPACWAIGLLALLWPPLAARCRPQWPVRWADRRSKLFRVVPMLAVLLSGVSLFTLVQNALYLMQAPYDAERQLAFLGAPTAAALMILLFLRILGPLWDACEDLCLGSAPRLALFQAFHFGWLMCAWMSLSSGHYYLPIKTPVPYMPDREDLHYWERPDLVWTLLLLTVALVCVLRLSRAKLAPPPFHRLSGALGKSLSSCLLCLALGVPLVWAVWEKMLPTSIADPALKARMLAEVEALDQEILRLPTESNGFFLLLERGEKPLFLAQDPREKAPTAEQIRVWSELLPEVKRALARPRFEPPDGTTALTRETLNGVHWGLHSLVSHYLRERQFEAALDCVVLELKMGKAISTGHAFRQAGDLTRTALEDTESWLAVAHPSAAQRRRLLQQLQASHPTLAEYDLRTQRSLCFSWQWLDRLKDYPWEPYSLNERFWRRYIHSLVAQYFNRTTAGRDGKLPHSDGFEPPQDWVEFACRRQNLSLSPLTHDFLSNLEGFNHLEAQLKGP